jgi:hypothetical protein
MKSILLLAHVRFPSDRDRIAALRQRTKGAMNRHGACGNENIHISTLTLGWLPHQK